ncbi:lyase family protein [Paenibacillus dokdonensis]|uniref:Lyase family protein n=1 Tax=Paenibacillus dokdonensis TaxID=2567944 RepID=A0ABU6GWT0_9BACL|nr:lyase family protein [Paenibacillus dokdonensis]MEC0242846.1 lyase family protein [Paenibacillus dokdonensis]
MTRIEQDHLGTREVPSYAYYGIQTLRAAEKFPSAGTPVHDEFIIAMACVKRAAAQANLELGMLPKQIGHCMIKAAEEIMKGKHLEDFKLDFVQGGTSDALNTNMNEVIANRALEFMLEDKGNYSLINPDGHVNLAQSSNGIITVALQIAAYHLTHNLIKSTDQLITCLLAKEKKMEELYRPGSTSVKIGTTPWLGNQFGNAARNLLRDMKHLVMAASQLQTVDPGEALTESEPIMRLEFTETIAAYLRAIPQLNMITVKGGRDTTSSIDVFVELSSAINQCAVDISKLCSDIRLAAASFPSDQNEPYLSIGVNTETSEALNQIVFHVIGLGHGIRLAAEAGMADQKAVPPIISYHLLESMKLLIKGMDSMQHELSISFMYQ